MSKLTKIIVVVSSLALVLGTVQPSFAAPTNSQQQEKYPYSTEEVGQEAALFQGVTKSCWEDGTCTLCDILVVFINVADGILRLFAILAAVFFVWGAGYMMMSSGNTTMIDKGKGIIRATIIGSIIVLVAWQLMNTVVYVMVRDGDIFTSVSASQAAQQAKYSPLYWYNVTQWCSQ